jgi:rhodanese-related sulfurtransferase
MSIEKALAEARTVLRRLRPAQAASAVRDGARLVDIRPDFQRQEDGAIPGAIIIERNHLEWRLDPASPAHIPEATDLHITWIIMCNEGYASSLAAASLKHLGLHHATDIIGGFRAWKDAALPVTPAVAPVDGRSNRAQTGRNVLAMLERPSG